MASAKNRLYAFGALVLAASFAGNVCSYFFQLASARMLGPSDYGELIALLSLLVVFTLPFGAVNAVLVRHSSILNSRGETSKLSFLYSRYFLALLALGVAAFLALLLLTPVLSSGLNLKDSFSIFLLGLIVLFTSAAIVPTAVLNGLQRFVSFSALLFLNPAAKLAIAFALMAAGFGLFGALSGMLLGQLAVFALAFYLLRKLFFSEKQGMRLSGNLPELVSVFLALGCMSLFNNVDILFVKAFFSSAETGVYGVASEVARIVFFLTSALTLVLMPKVSEAHSKREDSRWILYKTLGFVGLVSAACLAAYFAFPDFIVSLLFGSEYLLSAALVPLFGLGMAFYALSNVMVYYFISIGRRVFSAILWLFLFMEVGIFYFFHSSLSLIVAVFTFLMVLLFACLFAYSFVDRRPAVV